MASDLLSTIASEIDSRLADLRPLYAEYEQLMVAAAALDSEKASARRGRPKKPEATSRPARAGARSRIAGGAAKTKPGPARQRRVAKPRQGVAGRAVRGAAREAILAALDHGSHTVAELAVVTAMKAPNINGNLRRLLAEGAVVKTEREGKTAYARPAKA